MMLHAKIAPVNNRYLINIRQYSLWWNLNIWSWSETPKDLGTSIDINDSSQKGR